MAERLADAIKLPPGEERRAALQRMGFNISPMDFTDEELAEAEAWAAESLPWLSQFP